MASVNFSVPPAAVPSELPTFHSNASSSSSPSTSAPMASPSSSFAPSPPPASPSAISQQCQHILQSLDLGKAFTAHVLPQVLSELEMLRSDPSFVAPNNDQSAVAISRLARFVLENLSDSASVATLPDFDSISTSPNAGLGASVDTTGTASAAVPQPMEGRAPSAFQLFFRDCCDGLWTAIFSSEKQPAVTGDTAADATGHASQMDFAAAALPSPSSLFSRQKLANSSMLSSMSSPSLLNSASSLRSESVTTTDITNTPTLTTITTFSAATIPSSAFPNDEASAEARMLRVCMALTRTSRQQQWTTEWRSFVSDSSVTVAQADQFLTMLFDVIVAAILRYRVHSVLTVFSAPHQRHLVDDVLQSKETRLHQAARDIVHDEIKAALAFGDHVGASLLQALFVASSPSSNPAGNSTGSSINMGQTSSSLSPTTPNQDSAAAQSMFSNPALPQGPMVSAVYSFLRRADALLSLFLRSNGPASPLQGATSGSSGNIVQGSLFNVNTSGSAQYQSQRFLQMAMHNAVLLSHWHTLLSQAAGVLTSGALTGVFGLQQSSSFMAAGSQPSSQAVAKYLEQQQLTMALFSSLLVRLFHHRVQQARARKVLQQAVLSKNASVALSSASGVANAAAMKTEHAASNPPPASGEEPMVHSGGSAADGTAPMTMGMSSGGPGPEHAASDTFSHHMHMQHNQSTTAQMDVSAARAGDNATSIVGGTSTASRLSQHQAAAGPFPMGSALPPFIAAMHSSKASRSGSWGCMTIQRSVGGGSSSSASLLSLGGTASSGCGGGSGRRSATAGLSSRSVLSRCSEFLHRLGPQVSTASCSGTD